tara:strand:- start:200 stop:979 length:780 start_codon:yes stop_codon:yes gene_type:complete
VKFCCLGSGSEGNSIVVKTESSSKTTVLVDCGIKFDDLENRLLSRGIDLSEIDAIFITHEHIDHIRSALKFAKVFNTPIFMTHGSFYSVYKSYEKINSVSIIRADNTVVFNDLKIAPFSIPHDAREPVALIIQDTAHKLGVLTDTGSITPNIVRSMANLDGVVLEFNYDEIMLKKSDYPEKLKKRISSPYGHLSNKAATYLLEKIFHQNIQAIVAAHLSKKNNNPDLVSSKLKLFKNDALKKIIADQSEPTGWISLNKS